MFPAVSVSDVPTITTAQMVEVDRVMVEDLGIGLVQMMENAGRNLARFVYEMYVRRLEVDRVIVLAGSGGNGGGGLVAARRLKGWDVPVSVWTSGSTDKYRGVVADQLLRVVNLNITVDDMAMPEVSPTGAVIIDALVGYSLTGSPKGRVGELIEWTNAPQCPVISLDVPSGLDATTGQVFEPAVVADATLTLAMPKTGLVAAQASEHVGDLFVVDIGVPAAVYRDAFELNGGQLFAKGDIVRVQKS